MDGLIGRLHPELVYVEGSASVATTKISIQGVRDGIVPSKTSKSHKNFENQLKKNIEAEVSGVSIFPTDKEVLVIIEHGFSLLRDYIKIDLDNKSKCILDALEGVIYHEDSQVKILWCQKVISKQGIGDYFSITIKILSPKTEETLIKHIRSFS